MVAVAHGLIEIVQHHDDSQPQGRMEFFHKLHERQLVTNVEICRRLVEKQHFGLLRERHGEPRTLALAT